MQQKTLFGIFLFMGCILSAQMVSANTIAVQDTAASDSAAVVRPDYVTVNVIVETAWGTSDLSKNVDVYIVKENRTPKEIVLKKGAHQECSIELVTGLAVKILDPKTGKLIKQYGTAE